MGLARTSGHSPLVTPGMHPIRLILFVIFCVALATLTAQTEPTIGAGVPDPSRVPVKDDRIATDDNDILKMVIATREDAAREAIANVQVAVYDLPTGKLVAKGNTDEYGFLTVRVPFEGAYRVETCTPEYFAHQATINDCGSDGEPTLMCVKGFDFFTYDDALASRPSDHILKADFYLEPLEVGQIIDLDNILYDFDKATLRPESKTELNQLVRALEMLPGLDIELRSHTDSRGSDEYNKDLSQRRAQSVVDYLIAEGIDRNRFSARGFGESRLLNDCDDGVECTEEEHQRNRRTEFEITSYQPQPCEVLPEIMVESQVPAERQ